MIGIWEVDEIVVVPDVRGGKGGGVVIGWVVIKWECITHVIGIVEKGGIKEEVNDGVEEEMATCLNMTIFLTTWFN